MNSHKHTYIFRGGLPFHYVLYDEVNCAMYYIIYGNLLMSQLIYREKINKMFASLKETCNIIVIIINVDVVCVYIASRFQK